MRLSWRGGKSGRADRRTTHCSFCTTFISCGPIINQGPYVPPELPSYHRQCPHEIQDRTALSRLASGSGVEALLLNRAVKFLSRRFCRYSHSSQVFITMPRTISAFTLFVPMILRQNEQRQFIRPSVFRRSTSCHHGTQKPILPLSLPSMRLWRIPPRSYRKCSISLC